MSLHKKLTSDTHIVDGYEIEHEYDGYGNHRITCRGEQSLWCTFRTFPKLVIEGKTFMAASDYFSSFLPPVFRIIYPTITRTVSDIGED